MAADEVAGEYNGQEISLKGTLELQVFSDMAKQKMFKFISFLKEQTITLVQEFGNTSIIINGEVIANVNFLLHNQI